MCKDDAVNHGTYPAGRAVAQRVQDHFIRRLATGASVDVLTAPLPDLAAIEEVIEAGFWTSLRREEIYVPKVSIALLPASHTTHPLLFERPLAMQPHVLARVAPAVERPGIHLGAWRERADLLVWGTTRDLPRYCLVLEVAAPGLLVVKQYRGGEQTKFANVAVLQGDVDKVVDEHASSLPDCPSLLTSMLGFDSPASWGDSVNVLVQLSVSMRVHGRGGLLLVVPREGESWRESIVSPLPYGLVPPYTELAELMERAEAEQNQPTWREALTRTIDAIAGLTAVDGAAILTERYELLAFGAKIVRRRGSAPVEQVTVTEPVEGGVASIVHPSELGGTRHLSAAQFVYDQRHAVALVASQDGRFTIFAWSPCEDMVHAHRVETLLL